MRQCLALEDAAIPFESFKRAEPPRGKNHVPQQPALPRGLFWLESLNLEIPNPLGRFDGSASCCSTMLCVMDSNASDTPTFCFALVSKNGTLYLI